MTGVLTIAGLVIAAGDVSLVVACWKGRSVLGGVLGATGIPLVVYAIVAGPSHGTGKQALVIAAIALVVGTALYGLGQAFERLLDDGPEDDARDDRACRRLDET